MSQPTLTIQEVVKVAKISPATVYRRAKNGTFPAPKKEHRIGGRGPRNTNVWDREEVMRWAAKYHSTKGSFTQEPSNVEEQDLRVAPHDTRFKNLMQALDSPQSFIVPLVAALLAGIALMVFR